MVYLERVLHGKPIPHAYVRVTADMVHANAVDCKLDFPTTDTEIDTLGQAKNEFILWARRDITLCQAFPLRKPTVQPVPVPGSVAGTHRLQQNNIKAKT